MAVNTQTAAEWHVSEWINTREPITLPSLRGRVVVLLAFQMLCPGCVAHALPLASRVHRLFPATQVAMLGLHTVFEHHDAMLPVSLRAFVHEYRIQFPVGIDRPGNPSPIPDTMRGYSMRGTPTWLLFDRAGRLQQQYFGDVDALLLGADIMRLIDDGPQPRMAAPPAATSNVDTCDESACFRPGE